MNPEQIPDNHEKPSIFHRIGTWKDMILGYEPEEIEETAIASPQETRSRQASLRIQSSRNSRVAVRRNVQVFEDARLAADGLKNGEQQIINLEQASPQMGERIIDFLNGVCYALDGTVERVGDRVYMFVPANVLVEVDEGTNSVNKRIYPDA